MNTLRSGTIRKLAAPPKLVLVQGHMLDEKKQRTSEEAAKEVAGSLQELFVGARVRSWFQERGAERRKLVEALAELFRSFNVELTAVKTALSDTAKERSSVSEEEMKFFRALFEVISPTAEVFAAMSAQLKWWTRVSCIADAFNANHTKWASKLGTFFLVRGRQIHALETLCTKKSRFRQAIRHIEDRVGAALGGKPISVVRLFGRPTDHLAQLIDAVQRLLVATYPGHPDTPGLETMLARLRAAYESDQQQQQRDLKAKSDLQALGEIAIRMSSMPKGFLTYGRFFVADGEVQWLRPDKPPTSVHFMLFNDMLLLGRKKGKHFTTKLHVEFTAATIRDVPDGTMVFGQRINNGWVINTPDSVLLYALTPDAKGALFNLMRSTLSAYKNAVVKVREERAILLANGL